ncbi:MAG: 50S ribosomal protein L14 [Nitrospirae bacterium]|nr:50S ribosomal protein L14 [Nitrospirota bacterium]
MIGRRSILEVADNTGVRKAQCIGMVGYAKKRYARIGDIITISVREAIPQLMTRRTDKDKTTRKLTKGEVVRAVVVRTRKEHKRRDGTTIRFDDNAIVLVGTDNEPLGTRIFGPVARELRGLKFMKIVSLAPEVL